jgi:hypothetical protein
MSLQEQLEVINEKPCVYNKRPKWVWAISIFYFLSAVYTLLSFYLVHSGAVTVSGATHQYLASMTALDYVFSILLGVAGLVGAVTLFFLRKVAYFFFLGSLILNILMTVWYALSNNLLAALPGGTAVIGMIIGWGMLLAVCIYIKKLSKLGVLH